MKLSTDQVTDQLIIDLNISPSDYIFREGFDTSPVVIEKYKLIFFTIPKVGCTAWKQLFRRMSGYSIDQTQGYSSNHNPKHNGLKYLRDFLNTTNGTETVREMLTSSEWTKAIFVRDPKERFLSAYLEKPLKNPNYVLGCCCSQRWQILKLSRAMNVSFNESECVSFAKSSPINFLNLIKLVRPDDPHWMPQHLRMENKYWRLFDMPRLKYFVGNMANIEDDARILLQRLGKGAWEEFGQIGWGEDHLQPIFSKSAKKSMIHETDAHSKLRQYYNPELAALVDNYYSGDYDLKVLNLTPIKLF